ncbi:MAG: hypothetical protein OEM27_02130 [Nitrospinota bacterium]|nr:hypothetical protein [Nitrospinota bacterium]
MTWIRYGLMLLVGVAGFACSQEAREPLEVGTAQVELRSDLVLPETPGSTTSLGSDENPDHPGQTANSLLPPQRRALSGLEDYEQDRAFRDIQRYEFLPALLQEPEARKSHDPESNADANSWTLADKYWVRAGKGFAVAAEGSVSSGTIHPNDASYYLPAVVLKPYPKASERLELIAGSFKSRKPLVFHSGATGFAHEPPAETMPPGHSPAFETQLELAPIPETRVYLSAKPNTQVTLAPAKNRLDLMNGNENLNRHRFYQRR